MTPKEHDRMREMAETFLYSALEWDKFVIPKTWAETTITNLSILLQQVAADARRAENEGCAKIAENECIEEIGDGVNVSGCGMNIVAKAIRSRMKT
jgi:hypothetical protein